MTDIAPIGRRDLLARLAAAAFSITGLSAFKRFTPIITGPKWDDRYELAVDLEVAPQSGGR